MHIFKKNFSHRYLAIVAKIFLCETLLSSMFPMVNFFLDKILEKVYNFIKMQERFKAKLQTYFAAREDVLAVYLFGSRSKGDFSPLSDLDIGILLREAPPLDRIFETEFCFFSEISSLLGIRDIDIVIANTASLLLRHEIVKYGKLIYERDKEARCDFEVLSELKYYDTEPLRQLLTQTMIERLKKGEFGVRK
ncbi:MAG: nucleotidyltransferase domain-containing protein [Candidatus Edwardsbacteria bacterium]